MKFKKLYYIFFLIIFSACSPVNENNFEIINSYNQFEVILNPKIINNDLIFIGDNNVKNPKKSDLNDFTLMINNKIIETTNLKEKLNYEYPNDKLSKYCEFWNFPANRKIFILENESCSYILKDSYSEKYYLNGTPQYSNSSLIDYKNYVENKNENSIEKIAKLMKNNKIKIEDNKIYHNNNKIGNFKWIIPLEYKENVSFLVQGNNDNHYLIKIS